MSTPISGDNSNNLYISRQMADALKNKKDVVENILKDGVNSADKQAMKNLRAELELAAKADDGIINADEKSLLNALDANGMFGTSYEVVEKNLQALKQVYAADPNQVNFNGAQVTTEDGFTGFFGAEQSRVIRIRPDDTSASAPTPVTNQGETENTSAPPPTPAVTQTVQEPTNPLGAPAQQSRTALQTPVNEFQKLLTEPPNAALLSSIEETVKKELPADSTPEAIQTEVQSRLASARTAVTNYTQDPSSANLNALYIAVGNEPEFTNTQDPNVAKVLRDLQGGILTARKLDASENSVKTNVNSQYYQSPSDATQLQETLTSKLNGVMDDKSAFTQSTQISYQLTSELKALQASNPEKFAQLFPQLDTNSLSEMDTLATQLLAISNEQNLSDINPETLDKLSRLQAYTDQLKPNLAALSAEDSELQGVKSAFETLDQGGLLLSSAGYEIDGALKYKAQVQMELQAVRKELQSMLSQDISEASKEAAQAQIKAIDDTLLAITENREIPEESRVSLNTSLEALQSAKKDPFSLMNGFGFGFGGYMGYTGTSSLYSRPLSVLSPQYGFAEDLNLNLGGASLMSRTLGLNTGMPWDTTPGALPPSLDLTAGIPTNNYLSRFNTPSSTDLLLGTAGPRLTQPLMGTGLGYGNTTSPLLANASAPLFNNTSFSGISPYPAFYSPPPQPPVSLANAVRVNTDEQALEELLADPAIKDLPELDTIKTMLNDPRLNDQSKLYLQNALHATKLAANEQGEQTVGSTNAKANDLASDLSFLAKQYKSTTDANERGLLTNFVVHDLESNNYSGNSSSREQIQNQALANWNKDKSKVLLSDYFSTPQHDDHSNNRPNIGALLDSDPALKARIEKQKPAEFATVKDWVKADSAGFEKVVAAEVKAMSDDIQAAPLAKGVSKEERQAQLARLQQIEAGIKTSVSNIQQIRSNMNERFTTEIGRLEQMGQNLPSNAPQARQFVEQQQKLMEFRQQFTTTGQLPTTEAWQAAFGPNSTPPQSVEEMGDLIRSNQFSRDFVFRTMALAEANPEHRDAIMAALDQTLKTWQDSPGMNARGFGSTFNSNLEAAGVNTDRLTFPSGWGNRGQAGGTGETSTDPEGTTTPTPSPTQDGNGTPTGDGSNVQGRGGGFGMLGVGGARILGAGSGRDIIISTTENLMEDAHDQAEQTLQTAKASFNATLSVLASQGVPPTPQQQELATQYQNIPAQPRPYTPDQVIGAPPPALLQGLQDFATEYRNAENPSDYFNNVVTPMEQTFAQVDDNLMTMMQTLTPQLQQETQNLDNLVSQRQLLQLEIMGKQSEVAQASKEAIAEADALAASLDLSPKPTKSGNELTSELISDFLKTIQQLGADTRKLILARMAVQMLDRVIGERYKAQADEANKYHKQALDKMIQSFRDQIETSIKQAEAATNSDGQRLAAMSGEHAGIMGDANIRSKVEEILDRTMDISPPIMTDNQKREILNQLFDGDPSNDSLGLMGIVNNFELQRRTLMARGVSMN
jgi:hypothetical protein